MQRNAHSSEPVPPSLPPRPGARQLNPEPVDDLYDDCNGLPPKPDDVYDDCDEEKDVPPPLPPHPEAFYDDVGQQESPSPPPPPPPRPQANKPSGLPLEVPQETYDDVGPIVQQIPKRQLPATPPAVTPPASAPKSAASSVYELGDDEGDSQSQPPPPPPPPPAPVEDLAAIYEVEPQVEAVPAPPSGPPPQLPSRSPGPGAKSPTQPAKSPPGHGGPKAATAGGFAMNLGLLQNAKAGLKKVSHDSGPPHADTAPQEVKVYGECPETVYDARKMFQNKAEGKPGPIKQSSLEKMTAKTPKSSASPPVQTVKPVQKYEPPQAAVEVPDQEIYDDASSVVLDPLAQHGWYHGKIERTEGDRRIKKVNKDGTYLVRVSEKDPHFPFTLMVLHNKVINNLRIRKRPDGQVALGEQKAGEVAFKDVTAMMDHHQKLPVVLLGDNQSQVKLLHMAPKS